MPDLERQSRLQDAVLWPWTGQNNRFGENAYALAQYVKVRWNTERHRKADPKTNTVDLEGTLIVDRVIPNGSLLFLGTSLQWLQLNDINADGVMEVKQYKETPDIRNRKNLQEAVVMKYKGTPAPLTYIAPSRGWVSGLNPVTIKGSGFTGATSVQFGGVNATWFNVLNDNTILCSPFPVATAQIVNVTVGATIVGQYQFRVSTSPDPAAAYQLGVHKEPVGWGYHPNGTSLVIADANTLGVWEVTSTFQTFHAIAGSAFPLSCCAGSDGNIWVGDGGGNVYILDPNTYAIIRTIPVGTGQHRGICAGPAGVNGRMWVSDTNDFTNGKVWNVNPATGAATGYSLLGGVPYGIAVAPDGNLYVADSNGGVWRITSAGLTTPFHFGHTMFQLALDGNGVLWVPDDGVGNPSPTLYTFTTAGVHTAVPCTLNFPYAVCYGPDGNVYVGGTDLTADMAQFNLAGKQLQTILLSPSSAAFINEMIAGPDGDVWASNDGGSVLRKGTT